MRVSPRTLFSCTLHKWTVLLENHARINKFPTARAQPKPGNAIFYNGVEVQGEHVVEDIGQKAIHKAGLPSWTSASTAQAVQQKAQGLQQLAMFAEYTCVHTEAALPMTRSSLMEKECIAQLLGQPLMNIGRMLLQGHMQGCKKCLIVMFAKAAADGMLPEGLRLVAAISTFAHTAHLDSNVDEHDGYVKQQLAWSTVRKGDIALDSNTYVNVVNPVYTADVINASIEPRYDGDPVTLESRGNYVERCCQAELCDCHRLQLLPRILHQEVWIWYCIHTIVQACGAI